MQKEKTMKDKAMKDKTVKRGFFQRDADVFDDRTRMIRCRACKQLLGRAYPEARYLYLDLVCKCGANPCVTLGDRRAWNTKDAPRRLCQRGASCFCSDCGTPLFVIFPQVRAFAFRAVCRCGGRYNRRIEAEEAKRCRPRNGGR